MWRILTVGDENSNRMWFKIICFIWIIESFGNGVPLESSTDDLRSYFVPHIVGGANAPKAFAPHMAALIIGGEFKIFNCGASIVTSKLLMSAAHCIDMLVYWDVLKSTYHGMVGSNNWHSGGISVQFTDFHVHPGWDMTTVAHDIGFLVMEHHLQLSETVGVIPLNYDFVGEGTNVYVTGWGRLWDFGVIPDKLQILYMETIASDDCKTRVQTAAVEFDMWPPPLQPDTEICTYHSAGHGMCNGDSGSALVSATLEEQIGIVSWGFPCALGAPDVFVRISAYKEYIQNITEKYPTSASSSSARTSPMLGTKLLLLAFAIFLTRYRFNAPI